jgi:hypothetical protein
MKTLFALILPITATLSALSMFGIVIGGIMALFGGSSTIFVNALITFAICGFLTFMGMITITFGDEKS